MSRPVCFCGKLCGPEHDPENANRFSKKIMLKQNAIREIAAHDAMNRRRAGLLKRENPYRALFIVLA
jgi:hypothetical protein